MLLERVAHAGNVGIDFVSIGQPHTGDLTKSRVRLLRSRREHAKADASSLRTFRQVRRTGSRLLGLPALADQLLDCRHATSTLLTLSPVLGGVHDRFLVTLPAPDPHDLLPWVRIASDLLLSTASGDQPRPLSPILRRVHSGCFPSFKDKSAPVPASRTRRERRRGVMLPSESRACGESLPLLTHASAYPSEFRRRNAEMQSPVPKPPHLSDWPVRVNASRPSARIEPGPMPYLSIKVAFWTHLLGSGRSSPRPSRY